MVLRHRVARLILLLPLVFLAGCFTKQGIVMPWTLEHRQLNSRLDTLFMRLDRMDADQVELNRQTRAELGNQIAANREEIDKVIANIEDYGARLNQAALRNRPAPETVRVAAPDNSVAVYDQAYTDYMRGQYETSRQGFAGYLKLYPSGDRAANAQYWLGESYYSEGQYAAAQVEFQKVLTTYPESDKAPAAMFKIGKCLEKLGQKTKARAQYSTLIQKFPNAQEAKLAADLLK